MIIMSVTITIIIIIPNAIIAIIIDNIFYVFVLAIN